MYIIAQGMNAGFVCLNEQKMFSLLHEYLITDTNTEKKTKRTVQKI